MSRRSVTVLFGVAGAIAIYVNSFGQEALGWGFYPGGLVGPILLAIAIGRLLEDRRSRR